ncbi:histone-lysine N-methyltransferase SETMAR [Trichonephila clavipes]|nr:histone-lysine N-methyltransferase SETMAR [Trichonephila clavipes]
MCVRFTRFREGRDSVSDKPVAEVERSSSMTKTLRNTQNKVVPDNAYPHTANIVRQFLAEKGMEQIQHPSYSPDLNPSDFYLFSRLKLALKGKRFDDIPDVQRNVTRFLNSLPNEDLLQSLQDMYRRSQGCIVMGGDYFKGQ